MTIGEQLQQARKQHALTQQAVAEQTHVTRQTISNWETSRSLPDIDSLLKLSQLYHLSLDQLLRSGDMMTELHSQAKAKQQAQRVYRVNLLMDAILAITWLVQHLNHHSAISSTALLIIMLLVNLTTLRDARSRYWRINRNHFTLPAKAPLLIAIAVATLVCVWTLVGHPVTFYRLGYGIGTGAVVGLLVWGILPTAADSNYVTV